MNLSEIKARCDAATAGPWNVGGGTQSSFYNGKNAVILQSGRYVIADRAVYPDSSDFNDQVFSNMDFIAHARTDLPVCVAEIERLQAENSTLRRALEHACDAYIWR